MQWTRRTADLNAFWGVVKPPDETVAPSVSEPYSLGFNFSDNQALVAIEGRTERRQLRGMTGGVNGGERIEWIGLDRDAECVSITVSERLRRAVAEELRAPRSVDLGDVYDKVDTVFSALALRLRAAGRGGWEISSLELDELARGALRRLVMTHFGGRLPRSNAQGLDSARLNRITDYLDANLKERVLLDDLASIAAMSPFHFQRTFRRATGLTPHQYQTALRMGRAATLIDRGISREAAARAVGYTPGHGFRAALARFTGQ